MVFWITWKFQVWWSNARTELQECSSPGAGVATPALNLLDFYTGFHLYFLIWYYLECQEVFVMIVAPDLK